MRCWRQTLAAASVTDPASTRDYTEAATFMRRRHPVPFAALRCLVPVYDQPHLLAMTAFMVRADDEADHADGDHHGIERWAQQADLALAGRPCPDAVIRAFAHTVHARSVPTDYVRRYLDGERDDVEFSGFATDADVTFYIERIGVPALLVGAAVVLGGPVPPEDQERCRAAGQVLQRVDFLADMADDLGQGRLTLPLDALEAHGVRRMDLERGSDTANVRALLRSACERARRFLDLGEQMAWAVPPQYRSTTRAGIRVHRYWLDAVERAGAGVLRRTVRIPIVPSAWALMRGVGGMAAR